MTGSHEKPRFGRHRKIMPFEPGAAPAGETLRRRSRDKAAALANANAVIDLLMDGDTREISVSVNGYVGWMENLREDGSNPLQSASVSASASYVAK